MYFQILLAILRVPEITIFYLKGLLELGIPSTPAHLSLLSLCRDTGKN